MNYVLIFILLLPVKLLFKLIQKRTERNLVIQTAKIGDFINITPLLRHLRHSDALLSSTVAPLAGHDETIDDIFYIEEHKTTTLTKLKLAFRLMNRYGNVYVLYPNSINLFLAACCNARNKQFLSTYERKWYHGLFFLTATGYVSHSRSDLVLESYLKLADRTQTWQSYPKHATLPLVIPQHPPEVLLRRDKIKIGISISAGNQAKTIPATTWKQLINRLKDLPCLFFVFGTLAEQEKLDSFYREIGRQDNIINMLGKVTLKELPFALSKMDFYMASDSGNVYIADAQNVPVILLYGPCGMEEQRPLGDVLLIGPENIPPSSFIFRSPYHFEQPAEELFALNDEKLDAIHQFITSRTPHLATDKHS
ncbi:MAG: hypothetical protein XXXJIFNMEKO3_03406 [Candidatus Erwinia impunctatus]